MFRPIAVLVLLLSANVARAELVRFEILKREPFANGQAFGDVGPYERMIGRVHYAVDPLLRQNLPIVGLKESAKRGNPPVEFTADLFILAPLDARKGNGALLYDVNNRGNKLALSMFNAAGGNEANDPGNGFLMRHGFTVVWSGWDGELLTAPDRLRLKAPVVRNRYGPVRCEMLTDKPTTRLNVVPWDNHGSYRPAPVPGGGEPRLVHRLYPEDPPATIPRDQWTLHVIEVDQVDPAQLPKLEVELPAGFQPGHLYELHYSAQDPLVFGVGFAAVRDLVSALKHGTGEGNPFATVPFPRAHGFGVSQSGRFLREFVYSGFNEDEQGRKVFDGVIPHVSGSGMGSFNDWFAQPTRHCGQHDHHNYPADRFPFAYGEQTDHHTGQKDGILKAALATQTAPLVFHTQSAAEYWTRAGSLSHTDTQGENDVPLPDNVRFYIFGGTQHGPSGYPPQRGIGENLSNPGDYKPFLRALLLALDAWSKDGTLPPESVYPTLRKGTLSDWQQSATRFPSIPGVRYPTVIREPPCLERQRLFDPEGRGFTIPPRTLGLYPVLVPACGPDGNELGCLSPPEVAVPVATHTGWNLRRPEFGAERDLVTLAGSYIPFARTKAEREDTKDPRLSLEERYGTIEKYLEQLKAHCVSLEERRLLLPEDTARVMAIQTERVQPLFDPPAAKP